MSVDYYDAYQNGYRAGEVDKELNQTEGAHFCSPPYGADSDAWHDAQMWGYQDALDGLEPRSRNAVDMRLDSEYTI